MTERHITGHQAFQAFVAGHGAIAMKRRISMRAIIAAFTCIVVGVANTTSGQVNLRHPEQFYTNGEKSDGWTRDVDKRLRSTFWFAKNPANSLAYQQQIVIVYDSAPNKAYYFDSTTKEFIGRFDLQSEKYSLLPNEFRRERIEEIQESWFSQPGELPTIGEMFQRPEAGGPTNQNRMMLPPPTAQFPRLHDSSWDTNYQTADGGRIRAKVNFRGNRGTYILSGSNTVGQLANVHYISGQDAFLITGQWSLNGSGGYFSFSVPKDNMDVFWGDWGFARNSIDGAWDGARRPR